MEGGSKLVIDKYFSSLSDPRMRGKVRHKLIDIITITIEITAIPELLRVSDLKESIVTTDAMGTQKDTASLIIEKGGDYIKS